MKYLEQKKIFFDYLIWFNFDSDFTSDTDVKVSFE